MATQATGGGSTTSFTNTPQAKDDTYNYLENLLVSDSTIYNAATNTVTLDVMSNDLGGNAKSLFSVEDGDGNALTADFDLLTKDVNAAGVSAWEQTLNHNWVRINNGKVEYRIADGSGVPGQGRSVDSLTLNQDFNDQFVYAIRLGNGTLSEATVKIHITGANDAATIAVAGTSDNSVTEAGGTANSIPGDPSAGGTLVVNDADLGDNKFQAPPSASLNGTYGSFTFDANTGVWTYALDNNRSATQALAAGAAVTETLSVKSLDGSATYNIVVNVHGTNDAPVAVADTATTGENAVLSVDVLANDTDADDGHSFSLVSAAAPANKGSATIVAGEVRFDPGSDFDHLAQGASEQVVVNYTMQDEHGAQSSSTLTITVTGTNDAPVTGGASSASGTENDALISGTVPAASDADDGAVVTYHLVAGSVQIDGNPAPDGTVTVNANGSYSYAPVASDQGLDDGESHVITFNYVANDGTANSAAAGVTLTVHGVNDAPVLTGAAAVLAAGTEDNSYTVTQAQLLQGWTDVDVETLSVTGFTASNGSVVANGDGSYTITPSANYNGAVTLNYNVTDGTASVAASLGYNLTAVNDAPAGTNGSVTTAEDTSKVLGVADFGFTDPNDSPANALAAVKITTLPASGTLLLNGIAVTAGQFVAASEITAGHLVYNPAANVNGSTSFTFQVQDNGGTALGGVDLDQSANTLTINISAVNDAPEAPAISSAFSGFEDQAFHFTNGDLLIGFTDADGDALSVSGLQLFGAGTTLTTNPDGSYTITPDANFNGTVFMNYTVSDGHGGNTLSTQYLTFEPVNDAPVNTVPGLQNVGSGATLTFSSANSNAISIADIDAGTSPIQVTLSVAHGTIGLGSTNGITITGGANNSGTVTVQGTLAAINTALQGLTYVSGGVYSGPDTLTVNTNDLGSTSSVSTGPVPLSDIDTVSISVTPANAPPTAHSDVLVVSTGTSVFIPAAWLLANDTDPNSDTLSITSLGAMTSLPSGWSLTNVVVGGVVTGFNLTTSNANNQSLDIGYTISDGFGHSSTVVSHIQTPGTSSTPGGNNINLNGIEYNYSYVDAAAGSDVITGGSTTPATLSGTVGNDAFVGGTGDDQLDAGGGVNIMTGGAGNDDFIIRNFAGMTNHITDFDPGTATNNNNTQAVDQLNFDVGLTVNTFSVGDNDINVENFRLSSAGATNVAGSEVIVNNSVGFADATAVQAYIDGHTAINQGAIFLVYNNTLGHVGVYYDANPSVAGGAVLVAELDNILTPAGLNNVNSGDFLFF